VLSSPGPAVGSAIAPVTGFDRCYCSGRSSSELARSTVPGRGHARSADSRTHESLLAVRSFVRLLSGTVRAMTPTEEANPTAGLLDLPDPEPPAKLFGSLLLLLLDLLVFHHLKISAFPASSIASSRCLPLPMLRYLGTPNHLYQSCASLRAGLFCLGVEGKIVWRMFALWMEIKIAGILLRTGKPWSADMSRRMCAGFRQIVLCEYSAESTQCLRANVGLVSAGGGAPVPAKNCRSSAG
jgi:hypothetical protein